MIELDTIYNQDCLEGMRFIPCGSIDAIICDLPYGVLNKGNKGAKWDAVIPFKPLWEQYERIIKDNGAIILFGSGMFTAQLMMSNPKLWRYNLVWDKKRPSGFLNARRMPLRRHEDISVFYKSQPTYNPQMEKVPPYKRNHSRGSLKGQLKNNCYGNFAAIPTIINDEKYPISIIAIQRDHQNGKFLHPSQKPVDLLRYLIRTYTNEGDTVLDNCAGSGSTCIACIKEKRHFVGFELNKDYFDIACKWIDEVR